jgi:hypothetical protein
LVLKSFCAVICTLCRDVLLVAVIVAPSLPRSNSPSGGGFLFALPQQLAAPSPYSLAQYLSLRYDDEFFRICTRSK